MDSMKADLERDGYLILKNFFSVERDLEPIQKAVERIGKFVLGDFDFLNPASFQNVTTSQQSNFYRALRYLPELVKLASSEKILDIALDLGIKFPGIMHSYNIRMDKPSQDEFLFHWHQDITYLLGSLNSLTYWIPMVPVSKSLGTVELIPGSHLSGFYDFKYVSKKTLEPHTTMSPKDIELAEEPESDSSIFIEAQPGDLVVFYQLLLHRSAPNRSKQTRWTVQIRITDFEEPIFLENNYPLGDMTNIFYTQYISQRLKAEAQQK